MSTPLTTAAPPSARWPIALIGGVAALVLLALALWIWRPWSRGDSGAILLYGNVDIHQVSLAFNTSERITELRAREGDRVHAGEVLGLLDLRTPQVHLAQTEAQMDAQAQALDRLRMGSRPEEIAQARAHLAAAEAEAELAEQQVARLKAVGAATDGQAISQQDLDTALSHQKAALAQAQEARSAAELVILGPRIQDIRQAEWLLTSAQAEHALIERQIEESTLRAPVDGVVRARLLEVGDIASPSRAVYTLAITQPKWVRAYAPEARLSQLIPGMTASVTTDAAPNTPIPAKLGYISSVAEFTPKTVQTEELRTSLVYEVRFMVEDPDDHLRLGMPATVHVSALQGSDSQASHP
jgi:HlyD family secretion protein